MNAPNVERQIRWQAENASRMQEALTKLAEASRLIFDVKHAIEHTPAFGQHVWNSDFLDAVEAVRKVETALTCEHRSRYARYEGTFRNCARPKAGKLSFCTRHEKEAQEEREADEALLSEES